MAAPTHRRGPPPLTVATAAPPQGGGAIRGLGESVSADDFGGGAGFMVPLPFPDARGSSPALALSYQSGGGNGAFGSGVDIGLPAITRQTSKRVPRYDDTDVFVHATQGELVPIPGSDTTRTVAGITYRTRCYRPRLEGTFVAIEHWQAEIRDCWRLVDAANVTWLFGGDVGARIADPIDPARVFAWLLQERYDARGNHILYVYRAEDAVGIAPALDTTGRRVGANRYVAGIHWGNQRPFAESMLLTLDAAAIAALAWHFHAIFDYGDYDTAATNPYVPVGPWRARADPFSHYAAGFEIRTARLCRTIMVFHDFPAELGTDPLLVTAMRLGYDENLYLSLLTLIAEVGFRTDPLVAGGARVASPLPPLELGYSGFVPTRGAYREIALTGGTPIAVDAFEWVDLYGSGIPGLLQTGADGVRFWAPSTVDPVAARVTYAGPRLIAPVPRGAYRADGGLTLADVTGAGRPQWFSRDPRCPGYAEIGVDGGAGPFHPFESIASDQANPARQVVNVTGSGLPDLLMIAADRVEYTPSRGALGYGETIVVPSSGLPPGAPDQPGEARRFVDIFGSGQLHYVRVRNGAVTCWPNLGYGRFGDPIALANAPWLGVDFDPSRLFFADLDGTGPADLLYLASDGLRLYRNRAGNGFDDATSLPMPGPVDSLTRLDIVDLLGAGVPCLVVTRPSPLLRLCYLAVNHGVQPNRLTSVTNNRGHVTTLGYGTSAQAWLADRNRGVAWLTVPPMPVPLLVRLVDTDALSDTMTTRTFTYRHGYYDAEERALVGFAFVEERDALACPDALASPDGGSAYAAPPCVTRRWRDTGAAPGGAPLAPQLAADYFAGDTQAYAMPASTADFIARDAAAVRQARYAARGQLLREEVYGADGTPWAAFPYTVSVERHRISQVQPAIDGQASVFVAHALEAIAYDYERNPADPQVAHAFTLAIDAFGNVTDHCAIAYPRRNDAAAVPAQGALLATRTRATFLNVTTPFRLLGVVSEETSDELSGLVVDAHGYIDFAALVAQLPNTGAARFDWTRYRYAADPGGAALAPQCLPIGIEQAAFDRAKLTAVFAPALDPVALAALVTATTSAGGGYTAPADGDAVAYWWNPGNTIGYADASGFYRARTSTDPFGAATQCSDDIHALFVTGMTDALDNVVTVEAIDYQALQPARIRDPNGAVFEAGFDANGLVVVTSIHGSEGGTLMGFAPLAEYGRPVPPVSIAAVLAAPAAYLQDAASVFAYAMLGWCGYLAGNALAGIGTDPEGLWADLVARGYLSPDGVILARFRRDHAAGGFRCARPYQDHAAAAAAILSAAPQCGPAAALALTATGFPGTPVSPIAATIAYTDGFGRILQIKTLADESQPTIACGVDARPVIASATHNWLTSGTVRYNAKGDALQQFEPFFSATGGFDPLEMAMADGPATTFHYDAVGRLAQTDLPLGTLRATVHGAVAADGSVTPSAWAIADYDENDTLKRSAYYRTVMADPAIDPYEKAAVAQAALADGSPVRTLFDPLDRPVLTIGQNDGLVSVAGLETLAYDIAQATALLADLIQAGYLDDRGAPTIAFTPEVVGWTLLLPAPFTGAAAQIAAYVRGVQQAGTPVATTLTLDIRGNPVRIADQRLAASGAANATITYSLADVAVLTESADAGPRWQITNAAGNPILTRDGNGNVVTTSYDQRQRVAGRQLTTAGGVPIQLAVALYGDSVRAPTPDGVLQPYFAMPETWNLRGQLVALFDGAGLILAPFASFQQFALAHRIWIRGDAATIPDWQVADESALAALAIALAALPGPAMLSTLVLPAAFDPLLDADSFDGTAAYDPLGRMVGATDADGNATVTTYNTRGLIAALTFTPAGTPGTGDISGIGDIAGTGDSDSAGASTTIGPIGYDAHTQPRNLGVADIFVTSLDYDPHTFHLVGIETRSAAVPAPVDPICQAVRYYRDPVGNVMAALDQAALPWGEAVGAHPPQPTQRFTYDLLYRLITATGREGTAAAGAAPLGYVESFAQDNGGNVTAVTHRGGTGDWSRGFTIAPGSNRLASAAAIGTTPVNETFDHDANGNQTTLAGLDAIAWSYLNRIASTTSMAAPDGSFVHEDHVHSGSGQRVRTVRTTYPGVGQPATGCEEITYVETMEITRVRAGDLSAPVVAEWHLTRLTAGTLAPAQWLRWSTGTPAGQPAAAMRYPLVDVIGSVRQVLGADAAPLVWREYLPFGADAIAWAASDTDAALQRRRYAGQEQDAGLYGYDARHYAPQLMRWLSPDPGGMTDTLNLYQFVRGNPATCTDADGRITIHHWNVKDKNTPALQKVKFIKEFANLLNSTDDKHGSVVFMTEVMASVSSAAFDTFVDALNHHSSGGWTGRLLRAGSSEGGWRHEKIGILTKNVTVDSYFQLVAEHRTDTGTVKETHPTGAFTKRHAFNERQIIGVDISTPIGGQTDTLALGSYHNQGPRTGADTRAGRARGQAKKHLLHAVIGDWNVQPNVGNQDRPNKRMRTRGSGDGEEVTFDKAPTSKGKKLYDYAMSFNNKVGDRTLMVKNKSGNRGASSDHRQNSATLTTRKRKRDD